MRTDGCFIAVLSYLRRGETSGFYSQSHFVTYFRYLRFSPNGTCLSLLTTEAPPSVVRRLDGGLRMKGLAKGMWRLEGERLTCFELEEVGLANEEEGVKRRGRRGTDAAPTAATAQVMDEGMAPAVAAKYKFVMESRLRSTQRGKMNKLEIVSLATEHKVTGELTEVPLKHSSVLSSASGQARRQSADDVLRKPFFFSRVLAYES